jgi:UDP-N-acetyl-D-galactosamine dehydrogenase
MTTAVPQPVAVIGLGYVGLQLAVAFGRVVATVGYDIDAQRVRELHEGHDRQGEVSPAILREARYLTFTESPDPLARAEVCIVAVPTPVDAARRPDLRPLMDASRVVGQAWRPRARNPFGPPPIVVFESTVYPGCTEEVCIPILEQESGLRAGVDFKWGYSPERINPGDPDHSFDKVVKVVAGHDAETTDLLARLYGLVVSAGVYRAPDVRTAEAAKVIENIQRDLNIALMNELSLLFNRMGLDTWEVLRAARTKWNFLRFEPGLVGGHCIPVDPYYLTYKAEEAGYHPDVILAGRRINDVMGQYVAGQTVKLLIQAGKKVAGARVLVLGVAFKENVRDTRNTRVVDLVRELESHRAQVVVHDPVVAEGELARLGLKVVGDPFSNDQRYDAVILAVPHRQFRDARLEQYRALLDDADGPGVLIDPKGVLHTHEHAGVLYWTL